MIIALFSTLKRAIICLTATFSYYLRSNKCEVATFKVSQSGPLNGTFARVLRMLNIDTRHKRFIVLEYVFEAFDKLATDKPCGMARHLKSE